MNESVIPIKRNSGHPVDRRNYMPVAEHTLMLPSKLDASKEIDNYLESISLHADAKGLWMGYPNLKQSLELLSEWVSADWPSQDSPTQPAIFGALARAIGAVKEGLERKESDRRFMIANFHNGLTSIAKDISGFHAWGCTAQKAADQWEPFSQPFHTWCETGHFEKILFVRVQNVNEFDLDGLIWKMRSRIAPMHDIGVMHRYGSR